jgi:polyisoprenoid-binding protein YceI
MTPETSASPARARTHPARGEWSVDAEQSSASFSAGGFWGTVTVTGRFDDLGGRAVIDQEGHFEGELVIRAETLNTGLSFRDLHLRSRAFFDVKRHPEIRFAAHELRPSADGHVIHGHLTVRGRSVEVALPVELTEERGGQLVLATEVELDRAALGVGHSPAGMIRGPAQVRMRIVLRREG